MADDVGDDVGDDISSGKRGRYMVLSAPLLDKGCLGGGVAIAPGRRHMVLVRRQNRHFPGC